MRAESLRDRIKVQQSLGLNVIAKAPLAAHKYASLEEHGVSTSRPVLGDPIIALREFSCKSPYRSVSDYTACRKGIVLQRCPKSEFALHKVLNSYERYSCDFLRKTVQAISTGLRDLPTLILRIAKILSKRLKLGASNPFVN